MTEKQTKSMQQAVDVLLKEYQKAIDNINIKTPLSYAFYKTWRYVDSKKVRVKNDTNEN